MKNKSMDLINLSNKFKKRKREGEYFRVFLREREREMDDEHGWGWFLWRDRALGFGV